MLYTQFRKLSIIVLSLILLTSVTTSAFAAPTYQANQDIVDTAIADGRFTTLVTALQAANLVDTLKGEGPFTVFAPTDDAFAALPEGVLDTLLADIPALTDVLLYHVVPGQVIAADVVNLESADTVLGESVSISVSDGNVMVGSANVVITDIETSNGVIHVIDAVLVPEGVAASLESAAMEDATMESMAEDEAMEETTTAAESESPADLPPTGSNLTTTSVIIIGLVLIGMILALGGLALRVGLSVIK